MPEVAQNGRYQGKRFWFAIYVVTLITAGFFFGPKEPFMAFATAIGGVFVAYAGSQGATDFRKIMNGGGQ